MEYKFNDITFGVTPYKYESAFDTPFGSYFIVAWSGAVILLSILLYLDIFKLIRELISGKKIIK